MNDWQLVAAWTRGEEQAFEGLVRKYFPIVYSAAVRQLGDSHLAQDVAQSVFIIFARKAPKLSREVVLTGWFLRTTRFVVRDVLKQMSRRSQREQTAGALAALEQTAGWEPEWAEAVPLMDEALLALSAGEHACVVARILEERSFREIAQLLQIGEDAAQKRVSRGLEKMRCFLQRRGVKVGLVAIPAILGVNLAATAGPGLTGAAWTGVQAALHGKAAGTMGLALAEQFLKAVALRQLIRVSLLTALGVLLLGGGAFLALNGGRRPPAFRVSDPRVETLGRAWAVVAQRAAFVVSFPQGRPPAGNPNRAVYDQATAFVLAETTRISGELGRVLQSGSDRERLAEFLTVELRETLGLDARQQTAVFAQLLALSSQGPTFKDGLQALSSSKGTFAATLRQGLSAEQSQRFDQTYGADARGLLVFPGLVLGSG
jgi:RNA polymerase sigma factor (sigma-70 family)